MIANEMEHVVDLNLETPLLIEGQTSDPPMIRWVDHRTMGITALIKREGYPTGTYINACSMNATVRVCFLEEVGVLCVTSGYKKYYPWHLHELVEMGPTAKWVPCLIKSDVHPAVLVGVLNKERLLGDHPFKEVHKDGPLLSSHPNVVPVPDGNSIRVDLRWPIPYRWDPLAQQYCYAGRGIYVGRKQLTTRGPRPELTMYSGRNQPMGRACRPIELIHDKHMLGSKSWHTCHIVTPTEETDGLLEESILLGQLNELGTD